METIIPEKIKAVFDRLQDDESRQIFTHRLAFFLDGNYERCLTHLQDMFFAAEQKPENYTKSFLRLKDSFAGNDRIVLFGAGHYSQYIVYILTRYGLKADCFCDSDPLKQNTDIHGLPVISPETLFKEYDNDYILISSVDFKNEIRSFLLSKGIPEDRILFPYPNLLGRQYFIPEFAPTENEVFIDAGCYNGITTLDFIDFCDGRYNKIFGFEPDPSNFAKTVERLQEQKNIVLFNKGVWSNEAELSFEAINSEGSHFTRDGQTMILVTSIDKSVNEPATFIKMDVEGSELEALRGARETIRKNRPKLAICIYHKPEDVLTIPLYIREIVPEYRFYIRHHFLSLLETVLYAII